MGSHGLTAKTSWMLKIHMLSFQHAHGYFILFIYFSFFFKTMQPLWFSSYTNLMAFLATNPCVKPLRHSYWLPLSPSSFLFTQTHTWMFPHTHWTKLLGWERILGRLGTSDAFNWMYWKSYILAKANSCKQ